MNYGGPGLSDENYDFLFKILLIGDSGVGKSCLLLRYTDNLFNDNFVSTIGVDFKIKTIKLDGKITKLQIWDTAGQERFKTITSSYYRDSDGILMVYDITDPLTFKNIQMWLCEIRKYMSEVPQFLLVGNKADEAFKRSVQREEGEALSHQLDCPFFEASAKDCTNVDEIFTALARSLKTKFSLSGITHSGPEGTFTPTQTEEITVPPPPCGC